MARAPVGARCFRRGPVPLTVRVEGSALELVAAVVWTYMFALVGWVWLDKAVKHH